MGQSRKGAIVLAVSQWVAVVVFKSAGKKNRNLEEIAPRKSAEGGKRNLGKRKARLTKKRGEGK